MLKLFMALGFFTQGLLVKVETLNEPINVQNFDTKGYNALTLIETNEDKSYAALTRDLSQLESLKRILKQPRQTTKTAAKIDEFTSRIAEQQRRILYVDILNISPSDLSTAELKQEIKRLEATIAKAKEKYPKTYKTKAAKEIERLSLLNKIQEKKN